MRNTGASRYLPAYAGCVSGEGWPLCAKFVAFGLYAVFCVARFHITKTANAAWAAANVRASLARL